MMNKYPIEMLTVLASAKAYAPIIWDGTDVVASQDDDLNLQTISDSLKSMLLRTAQVEANVSNQRTQMNSVAPNVSMLVQALPDMQTRMSGIETSINGVSGVQTRLVTVESRMANVEADINNLVSGGTSGSGGLSTTYSNILSALNAGNYIASGTDITVEKVTTGSNAGSYRISYTGSSEVVSVKSSDNYIKVTPSGTVYKIAFNTSELVNYISATKGLQVDPAFGDKIVISPKPTLVRGDGTTIDVKYDTVAGEFVIKSLVTGGGTSSGSSSVDNKSLISTNGVISANPDYVNGNISTFSYESSNFNGVATVNATRFSAISEASIYTQLPQDKLANLAAVTTSELSALLKTEVFNTSSSSALAGQFYLLNDYNSAGSIVSYPLAAQAINGGASDKTFVLDIDFALRMEYITNPTVRYGNTFQLTDRNLIFPFYLYWVVNTSKNATVLVGGDVLRTANITGDGFGAVATDRKRHVINKADLASRNLNTGILQVYVMTGFKVATVADSIFNAATLNKYLVEPKFNAIASYL
jgi:hypothetical protein